MASPGGPTIISDRAVVVAQVFYGVTIPLVVLASATLGYRLWQIKARSNIWSDGCITIGYILTLVTCALYIPQSFLTPGPKPPAAVLQGQKGAFLSIPIWGLGMAFIKISVGLTLLRINSSRWFQIYIWFNIGLAAAYGFANTWFILFSCQPLSAAWGDFADPESAKCLPPSAIKIASVTGAVVSVFTDVLLSLAPISFLWNLKRPLRERVVLGCLMAMGLLAGVSSIRKNLIIADFGKPGLDLWAMNVSISTWTSLEMLLGTIAACTPFCKPALERCLSSVGISLSSNKSRSASGANITPGYGHASSSGYRRANERDAFPSTKQAAAAASKTKNLDPSQSDEDLFNGTDIEMQPSSGVAVVRSGIRKETDIQVHSSPAEEERQPEQNKYYLAV